MEKSGVLCVRTCDRPPPAISVWLSVFWWMHTQSSESDYMQQNRGNTHRAMRSCAGTHPHMNTHELHGDMLSDTLVYYHGWRWGKSLVAGQRSHRWDFMANTEIGPLVRERGLAEAQQQSESRMETLDKQRRITGANITGEGRNCLFSPSGRKSPELQQKQEMTKQKRNAASTNQKGERKKILLILFTDHISNPPFSPRFACV